MIKVNPSKIKILMICEAQPKDNTDFFAYAEKHRDYLTNTIQAFSDAGIKINTVKNIIKLKVYITTATKKAKIGYSVPTKTILKDSYLLEEEIKKFSSVKVFLLMGDVAIKSFNYIAKRQIGKRVIPAGSTYKIRKNKFYFKNIRVFPSYLQTGKNYLIEKSKRKMIAEDLKEALRIVKLI